MIVLSIGATMTTVRPAGAQQVLAVERGPTTISAYGETAAWSSYEPRSRNYRLMIHTADGLQVARVAPRRIPFDVNLGPGRDGAVRAVYSRCAREPRARLELEPGFRPAFAPARGCDVYSYDLRAGRERPVREVNRQGSSEYLPTLWKRRIAFVRRPDRRLGRPGVEVARLYDRGAGVRIPAGARPSESEGVAGPVALDLAGRRLAYVWEAERSSCPRSPIPPEEEKVSSTLSQMWLTAISRTPQARVVESACYSLPAIYFLQPSIIRGTLYYVAVLPHYVDAIRDQLRRIPPQGPRQSSAAPRAVASLDRQEDLTYYVAAPPPTTINESRRFLIVQERVEDPH